MNQKINWIVETGALVVVSLLPVCFDPFAHKVEILWRFEPIKVMFFQSVMLVVLIMVGALTLFDHCRYPLYKKTHPPISSYRMYDRNPLALFASLYMVVYVLSTVYSVDPRLSLWGAGWNPLGTITTLLAVLFFLLLAEAIHTRQQVHRIINALLVGSIPVTAYGIIQYLGLDPFNWISSALSPVCSTLGRSNFLGAYLAMIVPFVLWRISTVRGWKETSKYILILMLQVMCLLLTWARAALLSLLGGSLIFLVILAWQKQDKMLLALSACVLILGIYLLIFMNYTALPQLTSDRSQVVESSVIEVRAESVNHRLIIWRNTLSLIPSRWPLGYGPAAFELVFWSHFEYGSIYEGLDYVDDPHNLVLMHLMSVGILGLVLFLIHIIGFYKMMWETLIRTVDQDMGTVASALLGSGTAFLIQAQFNSSVIVLMVMFWLVLALGVSIYKMGELTEMKYVPEIKHRKIS